MAQTIRISSKDGFKDVARAAFPQYRGRLLRLSIADRPLNVKDCWDGGSRSIFTFVRLADLATMTVPPQSPYDRQIAGADRVQLPEGFVCVEHMIVCGQDRGLVFHVHPNNVNGRMLAQRAAEVR